VNLHPQVLAQLPSGPPGQTVWYRAIQPQHWGTALQTNQTKGVPSRFNPGAQIALLYLAEDPMVALFEAQALLGSPLRAGGVVPNPRSAWTTINVTVTLSNVAHLVRRRARRILDMSAQELTGDWLGYRSRTTATSVRGAGQPAPTQHLGSALHAAGFEGLETISARVPHAKILAVFPSLLDPNSSVVFDHPSTGEKFTITSEKPDGEYDRYRGVEDDDDGLE